MFNGIDTWSHARSGIDTLTTCNPYVFYKNRSFTNTSVTRIARVMLCGIRVFLKHLFSLKMYGLCVPDVYAAACIVYMEPMCSYH